jgi:hypothetical protein
MALCINCGDHHQEGTACPPYIIMVCECGMEHPMPWDCVGLMNQERSYCGCGREASFSIKRDEKGDVCFQECGSFFEEWR